MPRYKVLKGVAHNIGHSFTSLMNYADDDYTMGHILRFARETRTDRLTIDFVTGTGKPAALLREPISGVPRWYTTRFWDLVASSGSDRSLVKVATLTIQYDLTKTLSGPPAENPYVCDVSIVDDRGKCYRAHFAGWWYVEKKVFTAPALRWWNPMNWFRRESLNRD
jgi:hypothetical protein